MSSLSMVLYFGLCSLIRLHSSTRASSSESVRMYSNLAIRETIFSIFAVLFLLLWKYWRTLFFRLMAFPT